MSLILKNVSLPLAPFTLEVDTGFATRKFVLREPGSKTFTVAKN